MTSPKPAHETIPYWPPSNWNGGRDQIGIGGRLRRNPHSRRRDTPHTAMLRKEADLLNLCAKSAAISVKIAALLNTRHSFEDEERTEHELNALQDKQSKIRKRIASYRPMTEEALVAVARVARDGVYLCDGEVMAHQPNAEHLAWMIVNHVAGMPQLAELY